MKIKLQYVEYMPKELERGILYVSRKYGAVAHLCACGCGSKIRTPLGPTEWTFEETKDGPSLNPSIGNWQLDCQSHYWIYRGEIYWADKWSPQQIAEGRQKEQEKRKAYYDSLNEQPKTFWEKLWRWIKSMLKL